MSALLDYTGASYLCCTYARDAAEHGQFVAAHSLFQSAIAFYDRAQKLAAATDSFSFHDSDFNEEAISSLLTARAELDFCALSVYPGCSTAFPTIHEEELYD